MIYTDGKPTVSSAGSTPPRALSESEVRNA